MAAGGIKFKFTIQPGTLDEDLERSARLSPQELTRLLTEILERARTEIIKRTPVGHSGAARAGWTSEIRGRNTSSQLGIIANPVLHVDPLDTGRRPGKRPPIEAIIPWVGSKLGVPPGPARRSVAFLVARSIGARGTQPVNMIEEGWEEARKQIKPKLKEMGIRIVRRL